MHFTYQADARPDLHQGDIISRTPEVEALLRDVHPHYFQNGSYKFFVLLTQSCDLVRRDGQPCKARYISIAAARPLSLVVEREIAKYQRSETERRLKFCNKDFQPKLIQFLERLLNNNEDEYFYLYREPAAGLTEDHCAFLHLSIAVKAGLHYDTLKAARVLQLTNSFQHKLGYLVGSLYSRVGTEDWVPDTCNTTEFDRRKREPIEDQNVVLWLERSIYKAVAPKLEQIANARLEDLQGLIQQNKSVQESKKTKALEAVAAVLVESGLEEPERIKAMRLLENKPDFITAFR